MTNQNEGNKLEKQKEVLKSYADKIRLTLDVGLNNLRALDLDVSSHEQMLNKILKFFESDTIPNKSDLSKALMAYDGEIGMIMYKWLENLGAEIKHPELLPKLNEERMKWAKAYGKALDGRHNRGVAGFD